MAWCPPDVRITWQLLPIRYHDNHYLKPLFLTFVIIIITAMPWSLSSSLCSQIVTTFCICHNVVIVIKSTRFFLRPHHCSHIWWECHLASLSRRLQSNDPSLTHSLNFPLILQRQDIITIFFFISFHSLQNHMKKSICETIWFVLCGFAGPPKVTWEWMTEAFRGERKLSVA